jgi:hypothetical protein
MAKIMGIIVFMNNEVNIDEVKKDLANEVTIDQVIDGTINHNGKVIPTTSIIISGDWDSMVDIQFKYGIVKDYEKGYVWYPADFIKKLEDY